MSCPITSKSITSVAVVTDALKADVSALTKASYATDIHTNPSERYISKLSRGISLKKCRDTIKSLFSTDEEKKNAGVKGMFYCEGRTIGSSVRWDVNQSPDGTSKGGQRGIYHCESPKCPKCSYAYRDTLRKEVCLAFKEVLKNNINLKYDDQLIPQMITLTASNNSTDVSGYTNRFKSSLSKFCKYTNGRGWDYWFRSMEATFYRLQHGLHVHSHMMILVPRKDLQDAHMLRKEVLSGWRDCLIANGLKCSGRGVVITDYVQKTESEVLIVEDFLKYILKDNLNYISRIDEDSGISDIADEVIAKSQYTKLGKGVTVERVVAHLAGEINVPLLDDMGTVALPQIRGFLKSYYQSIKKMYQKSTALNTVVKSMRSHTPADDEDESSDPSDEQENKLETVASVEVESDGWKFLNMKSYSSEYSFNWDMLDFWYGDPDIHRLVEILDSELSTGRGHKYHYDIYFEDSIASRKYQREYYSYKQSQAMALAA